MSEPEITKVFPSKETAFSAAPVVSAAVASEVVSCCACVSLVLVSSAFAVVVLLHPVKITEAKTVNIMLTAITKNKALGFCNSKKLFFVFFIDFTPFYYFLYYFLLPYLFFCLFYLLHYFFHTLVAATKYLTCKVGRILALCKIFFVKIKLKNVKFSLKKFIKKIF